MISINLLALLSYVLIVICACLEYNTYNIALTLKSRSSHFSKSYIQNIIQL